MPRPIPDELKGKLKVTINGEESDLRLGHFNGSAWMAFKIEGTDEVEYRFVTQKGPTYTEEELAAIRVAFLNVEIPNAG